MMRRTRVAFALLLAAQAAHSVEEYVAKLYDVFPPARFVSSLFSDDLRAGALSWFWAALEIVNGTVHSILAVARLAYFPGVLTAPLLIASGAWLSMSLIARTGDRVSAT